MTDLEKIFISDFKMFLSSHKVSLEKGFSGSEDGESEIQWLFDNDADERKNEIYLTMEEIHKELVKDE